MESIVLSQRKNFGIYFDCLGLISRTPSVKIGIDGYADSAECSHDCLELSNRRAKVVFQSLIEMNFPKSQVRCVIGHGVGSELDLSGTEPLRNRRVEFSPAATACDSS
ncbi:MAG: OmpA family protein [Xanthomonadales bacterium]|nr:OmpA family protein [Xanthomonadales bacterium]